MRPIAADSIGSMRRCRRFTHAWSRRSPTANGSSPASASSRSAGPGKLTICYCGPILKCSASVCGLRRDAFPLTPNAHPGSFKLPDHFAAIVRTVPAEKSELKAGARIFIAAAVKAADGTLTAQRVTVGLNGRTPPM